MTFTDKARKILEKATPFDNIDCVCPLGAAASEHEHLLMVVLSKEGALAHLELAHKEAVIAEWQKLIDDINAFEKSERKPGERRAEDFGSAGAAMEREMIKKYGESRIAQLTEGENNG